MNGLLPSKTENYVTLHPILHKRESVNAKERFYICRKIYSVLENDLQETGEMENILETVCDRVR